jgi:hypothetical protein
LSAPVRSLPAVAVVLREEEEAAPGREEEEEECEARTMDGGCS